MKQFYTLILCLLFSASYSQIINFPDPALKAALLMSADSNSDGEITQAEAAAATDIFLSGTDIVNPSGLEYFTGVSYFYMTETSIVNLDLSAMTGLYSLSVSYCDALTSLTASGLHDMSDISVTSNPSLQTLSVTGGEVIGIHLKIKSNAALTTVNLPNVMQGIGPITIEDNAVLANLNIASLQSGYELIIVENPMLTSLDLSDCSFESVQVSGNGLTSIDITNLSVEGQVDFSFNALTSLDLSTLSVGSMGGTIDLSGNNYTQIELVGPWTQTDAISGTPSLKLNNTSLTSLHFAQPVILSQLIIQDNLQLQTLSFQNNEFETCGAGYCSIDSFLISGNTALTSVCTDPFEVYALESQFYVSGTDWIHQIIGPDVTVYENCDDVLDIPDANFKNALVNTICVGFNGDVDNPLIDADLNNDGEIQYGEALAVSTLKVDGQGIESLAGIEHFFNMTALSCSNNQLTSLVIGDGMNLAELDCSNNQLTELDVQFDANEEYDRMLDFNSNQLSSLSIDVGSPYGFVWVNAYGNQFTDASQLSDLPTPSINIGNNPFVTLEGSFGNVLITNCPLLTSCTIWAFDAYISNNPQLTFAKLSSGGTFEVHDNPLLQSVSIKDGYAHEVDSDWGAHKDLTGNPSLEFVCVDDLGVWYNEGGWFFQHEMVFVETDPGVALTFYCDFTPGGGYNTLTGSLNFDCGGTNEPAVSNIKVNMDTNSNGNVQAVAFPDANGQYTLYTTGNGTITPEIESDYFTVSPANAPYAFVGSGNTQTTNFCITPNGTHPDLDIYLIPLLPARPGFDATYKIKYSNKGTETQSGTVSLTFEDDVMDSVSATPVVSSQSTGTLTWDFSNLAPFESREIDVTLNVNSPVESPAVVNGDVLEFSAVVSAAADETPQDNLFALSQTVVGSYDPNDKSVSKTSINTTELGNYLYYTIRFENTGTFYAENIAIRDLLSKNLDLSTLETVAASHNYRALLTHESSTTAADKLEFFFEGIQLPATIDDPIGSHGFVTYRIKPKNNLVIGNTIVNEAEIYFDFNAPIVTNEVVTTVTALGRQKFEGVSANLYPNPTNNQFTVEIISGSNLKAISIYNLIGQKIKEVPVSGESLKTVSVSDLQSGTYLISIETDKGKMSKKLVKL